ncbi:MAG: tyrosine-protein phosphatase [Pyrinomonadaceae bacterium]
MKKLLLRSEQRKYFSLKSEVACSLFPSPTIRCLCLLFVVLLLAADFSTASSAASGDCNKRALPAGASIQEQATLLKNSQSALRVGEPDSYSLREARNVSCSRLLRNFDRFSASIYRGGQPVLSSSSETQKMDGISLLRAIGVTDIINLRGKSKNDFEQERARSNAESITFHSIPLPSLDFGLPGMGKKLSKHVDDVARAVALAQKLEADGRVVYIHCSHGADRTGVVVAMMRLLDGATLKTAMAEAEDHSISVFQNGMRDFIERYADADRLKEFRNLVEEEKKSL